jgi:hypothetical protein
MNKAHEAILYGTTKEEFQRTREAFERQSREANSVRPERTKAGGDRPAHERVREKPNH